MNSFGADFLCLVTHPAQADLYPPDGEKAGD